MSYFEVGEDDLDLILDKYVKYYLKELTFYGTSKTEKMLMLIHIGQELNLVEKNIINNYYNKYIDHVKKDVNNPNIYYLQKIFFRLINLIIQMTMLWVSNKLETEEFEYKSIYLVGAIENFVEKIMFPIDSNLNKIFNSNKIFKLENSTSYLKKFIELNKNKFTSREKILKLNKLFNLLDNI